MLREAEDWNGEVFRLHPSLDASIFDGCIIILLQMSCCLELCIGLGSPYLSFSCLLQFLATVLRIYFIFATIFCTFSSFHKLL